MEPCVPIPLENSKLMDLVDKAKDYCLMHGICMRQKDRDGNEILLNIKGAEANLFTFSEKASI